MKRLSPVCRRDLLRGGAAAAVMAAGGLIRPTALVAKAPMQDSQIPGFFRFHVGAFEITIVSDGNLIIPAGLLAGNVPEVTLKAFLRSHQQSTTEKVSHLNAVLINTGSELILIDVGAGENFQASGGRLVTNLKAAGYKPGQVDRIILTHAHPDHIWGLTDDFEGGPRFPNASYVIASAEWDFWTDAETVNKVREDLKGFALGARKHLLPLADKMKRVNPVGEIAPGVRLLDTHGHTPGHISVMIEQNGDRLLVTGDVLTSAHVSFEQPDWQPGNDMDKAMGVKSRRSLLKMAAAERIQLLCYHLPFPGLGYAMAQGKAYRWVQANWQWSPRG